MSFLNTKEIKAGYGFKMDGYWVWCGSVISDPVGGYQMYAARWPKEYPMFEGYIFKSEIVRAWSDNLYGSYEYVETVLPCEGTPQWCRKMVHNPTVVKYKDKYLLYFIGSTYSFDAPDGNDIVKLRNKKDLVYDNIRIGMAVSETARGPWRVMPEPILLPREGKWDDIIVTNPAPCITPEGKIYLYYRSNTPDGLRIGLAVADTPDGPYKRVQDKPVTENFHIEDPFVWHNGTCFNMLAKDISGNITDGEKNCGAYFISEDGINWKVGTPAKGYSRTQILEGKGEVTLGCVERPQLFFNEEGFPVCMFAAAGDGPGHFTNAVNTWNMAIPVDGINERA